MEAYRSGHNEPDSKSGSPPGLVGSNPTVSVIFIITDLQKIKFTLYKWVNIWYHIGMSNYYSLWLRVVTLCNTFQRVGGRCKTTVSVGWMDLWGFGWTFYVSLERVPHVTAEGYDCTFGWLYFQWGNKAFFILITAWVDTGWHSI